MLGVTSQTRFTYFAYAKDFNFAQGGWGKNLDGWRDGWVGERAGRRTDGQTELSTLLKKI